MLISDGRRQTFIVGCSLRLYSRGTLPNSSSFSRWPRDLEACTFCGHNNELDLLDDEDVDSFTGSLADFEGAAAQLFASAPHPQPLRFESLSLTTPAKSVPPSPGTTEQQKIESKLEKSLGSQFNIQLQQQRGVFQASMLEAMKSL